VVLDYCCAVRGILNDDQGGPLHPPGLRMAAALSEVRDSLSRVLALNKPGPAHGKVKARATGYNSGRPGANETCNGSVTLSFLWRSLPPEHSPRIA
jgi:hypothetical protein